MGRPRYTEQGKPKTSYNEGLTVGCTKTQVGKGKRIIITDAMMQNGPVDGGLWIFKAETKKKKRKTEDLSSKNGKQKSVEKDHSSNSEDETKEERLLLEEDYHDSMNAKNFEKYFASVCEKLPKNSVIVIDHARITREIQIRIQRQTGESNS